MTDLHVPSIVDREGRRQEVKLDVTLYKEAFDTGISFPQLLNMRFPTDHAKYGAPFQQLLATAGIALKRDQVTGLPASRMCDIMDGAPNMAVVRPDGTQALTVAGRMLFPAVIMQWIEAQLYDNWDTYEASYLRMVGLRSSSASARVDQPIINLAGPRESLAQPIAQGAEPVAMATISLSDRSYRIPTRSVGFEITDEASKSQTIDIVGVTLQNQIIGQRIAMIDYYLSAMMNGDSDVGLTPLPGENASSYAKVGDTAISATNPITQAAWVKWLRKDWKRLNIDWVICDIDSYLAIENRLNRPTIFTDAGQDMRLNTVPKPDIRGIPDVVNFFIVDTSVIGANTIVGIDSRKAIHQITYVGGQYSAVEQYVMRRSSGMRFDFAEMSTRQFANNDGWKKLILGS